jgi:ATP-dependent DNA ligase
VLKYFDFESGVYIQPKLDGIRCMVMLTKYQDTLQTILLSRTGKQFTWLNHLRKEAKDFLSGNDDIILDCEVYAETIYGKLEASKKKSYSYSDGDPELLIEQRFHVISGAVRPVRKEAHPLEDQLCLYVFDIADPTGKLDQDERFNIMKRLFARKDIANKCPHIKRVETKIIYYPEEVEDYHDEVATKGYEGVVIRSRELSYESDGCSLSMRKYKMFEEKEFPIVDVCCDEGVDREQFAWVCEKIITLEDGTTELKTFNVKPMGTREQKWDWYDHSDEFLGKLLTVKYQGKGTKDSDENDVPRFPIGKSIRDYE